MSNEEILDLATVVNSKSNDDVGSLKVARATVVSVASGLATIDMRGGRLTGVPFYDHLALSAGNVVDVLLDGPAPRIIGKLGANVAATSGNPGLAYVAQAVLTATQQVITFTSLPQTYRALEILIQVRSTATSASDGLRLRLNGDASTAYVSQDSYDNGSAITALRSRNASFVCGEIPTQASANPGYTRSIGRLTLSDYADTAVWTSYLNVSSSLLAGTGPWTFRESGFYELSNAITQLDFITSTNASFVAGSKITIYGWSV